MKTDLAEPGGPDMGQMALVVRRAAEEMERLGRDLLRLAGPFAAALAELIATRQWQIRAGSPRPLVRRRRRVSAPYPGKSEEEATMTLKVTVHDVEEGTTEEVTVVDGDFLVLAIEPCYVANVQAYPLKGTQVVTVKGHAPRRQESGIT